jgi:hypothetical protein
MPPGDAPILTGDHPPLGNADINARVRTIVKWQSLYSGSDDGDKPRIRAELVERCPRSSGLSNGKGKLKAGYWSARVRPTAQQMNPIY